MNVGREDVMLEVPVKGEERYYELTLYGVTLKGLHLHSNKQDLIKL